VDRDTAIEFTKRIEAVFVLMGGLGDFLKPRLDHDDFRHVMDKWGRIVMELDLGVLEVIYRAHPDLRPDGMTPVAPLGAEGASRKPGAEPDDDSKT